MGGARSWTGSRGSSTATDAPSGVYGRRTDSIGFVFDSKMGTGDPNKLNPPHSMGGDKPYSARGGSHSLLSQFPTHFGPERRRVNPSPLRGWVAKRFPLSPNPTFRPTSMQIAISLRPSRTRQLRNLIVPACHCGRPSRSSSRVAVPLFASRLRSDGPGS